MNTVYSKNKVFIGFTEFPVDFSDFQMLRNYEKGDLENQFVIICDIQWLQKMKTTEKFEKWYFINAT